jgi:hypothetical protein
MSLINMLVQPAATPTAALYLLVGNDKVLIALTAAHSQQANHHRAVTPSGWLAVAI